MNHGGGVPIYERIPSARVAPVVRRWIDAYNWEQNQGQSGRMTNENQGGAQKALAVMADVSERAIYRILKGGDTGGWSRLDTVDRIYTAIGCIHLFHRTVEEDPNGLADVYFHEAVMDPEGWAEKQRAHNRRLEEKRKHRRDERFNQRMAERVAA